MYEQREKKNLFCFFYVSTYNQSPIGNFNCTACLGVGIIKGKRNHNPFVLICEAKKNILKQNKKKFSLKLDRAYVEGFSQPQNKLVKIIIKITLTPKSPSQRDFMV
jgi:hypothetical protein